MAKEKKLVEAITSMEEDFAQWYTDVVKKAELVDYTSVKGCMVIKPAGYAIWENIQRDRGRECVHATVYPGEFAAKGERSCGGFCAGGGLGDTWRIGRTSGETVRTADIRDTFL